MRKEMRICLLEENIEGEVGEGEGAGAAEEEGGDGEDLVELPSLVTHLVNLQNQYSFLFHLNDLISD